MLKKTKKPRAGRKRMLINNGVITALVTPFKSDGEVDYASFESLLDFQWQNGIKQFVVNGTTAESPNLNRDEISKLVNCVRKFNSDAKIILGTGSNSTKNTIEMTAWGQSIGVDAALVVVPYYNKPPQKGLEAHFTEVAKKVDLPILMYNVPGRTVISMSAETTVNLSGIKNIIGTKEASGDMDLMKNIKSKVNPEWQIFSGDDDTCMDLCLAGGHGVISVVSHLIPKEVSSLIDLAMSGDNKALEKYAKYKQLLTNIYIEPNPIPVKWALQKMGIIKTSKVRLPLIEMSTVNSNMLLKTLEELALI